jgi:hypothetical protein
LEVKKKVLILMSFRQVIDSNSEWFWSYHGDKLSYCTCWKDFNAART